jgi:hypothetical protein
MVSGASHVPRLNYFLLLVINVQEILDKPGNS